MSEKIVCRVDANKREVIVFRKDEDGETTQERYKAVLLKDAEWGAGMIRGELVETYKYPVASQMTKRAYYNSNHVPRYVDKYTREVLIESPAVMLMGSSVLYAD